MSSQITKKPLFGPHPTLADILVFQTDADKYQYDKHEHQSYSIIKVTEGAKILHLEGTSHTIHQGQVALINPNQIHGCEPFQNSAWAHNTFYINRKLLDNLASDSGYENNLEFKSGVVDDKNLLEALNIAHTSLGSDILIDQETNTLSALSLIIERFTHKKQIRLDSQPYQSRAKDRVEIYKEILAKDFIDGAPLSKLADATNVTRFQVIRDFNNILHISPAAYTKMLRLAYAKRLINDGISMSEAATMAGFSDQSHFSRIFRRTHGFSPKHFQAAIKDKNWDLFL